MEFGYRVRSLRPPLYSDCCDFRGMLLLQWRDPSQIYPTIPIMRKPTIYQSTRAKRRTQSLVIGVTWYTPETWAEVKATAVDPDCF